MRDPTRQPHVEGQIEAAHQRDIDTRHRENRLDIVDGAPRFELGDDQDAVIGIGDRLGDVVGTVPVVGNAERAAAGPVRSIPRRRDDCPGLLGRLHMRNHEAPGAQVEELDKVRVDVQLVAVLTQPAGDPEAQPFALVGETERRVEAGDDEAAAAARAPLAETGHAGWILDGAGSTADVPGILGTAKSGRHDPLVPRWPVPANGAARGAWPGRRAATGRAGSSALRTSASPARRSRARAA